MNKRKKTMSVRNVIEKAKELKLTGVAQALENQINEIETQNISFEDRLMRLLDDEKNERDERERKRYVSQAKFKIPSAMLEDINYQSRRGIDRSLINSLSSCQWVLRNQNTFITGPAGVGKSWLACALGNQVIRNGMPAYYTRVSRLLEQTEISRSDGTLPKLRSKLSKTSLLILDDWGMSPISDIGKQDLLEFIDDRIDIGSVIIASQLPVKAWYDYINEPTLADAILDRIVHRAHKIELRGSSMRKRIGMGKENEV